MLKLKRLIVFALTCALIIGISVYSLNSSQVSADNISNEDNKIKVFIGGSLSLKSEDKADYIEQRKEFLKDMKSKNANDIYKGTVVFNTFFTVEDLYNLIDKSLNVEKIWFSIPGETGRHMTIASNNNFKQAIRNFINDVNKDKERDNAILKQHKEIENGNFGIFAITVEGNISSLELLSNNNNIRMVDLHYNENAIEIAQDNNKRVVYIEVPEKPDGTK